MPNKTSHQPKSEKLVTIKTAGWGRHYKTWPPHLLTKMIVLAAVVILGSILIFNGHAATPAASIEAESGTVSGTATKITDTTASGGNAVKFGSTALQTVHCMPTPSVCGFPDMTNTGVPAGTHLVTVNSSATDPGSTGQNDAAVGLPLDNKGWHWNGGYIAIDTNGAVLDGVSVNAGVAVCAGGGCSNDATITNVTIKDSDISVASPDSSALKIYSPATNTLIEDSSIHGQDDTATNGVEYGVSGGETTTKALRDSFYNCTECYYGPGTVQDSYLITSATIPGSHYEDTYDFGGAGNYQTLQHDTLLNPHSETAVVYGSNDAGNFANMTVNDSLLAGGGNAIYGGGSAAQNDVITNNHFSTYYFYTTYQYETAAVVGPDSYCNPEEVFKGAAISCFSNDGQMPASTTWSGNIYDDDYCDNALEGQHLAVCYADGNGPYIGTPVNENNQP